MDSKNPDQKRQALHWLAILFAVSGLGLFNNILENLRALQLGFPAETRLQRDLAVQWCRCSTSCLTLGGTNLFLNRDIYT